ncbi:ATP-binding protein [Thermus sp.]|uniref:ATP-binding protein n=1 Tax=Thermus sp. TaxID=275 RepID=UPI003D10C228
MNPSAPLVWIPYYRKDPWPLARPLYDFFFRGWGKTFFDLWTLVAGPMNALGSFVLFPIALYVLGLGFGIVKDPTYFPWAFWLGGFVAFWVQAYDENNDPQKLAFHKAHFFRKLNLLSRGVGGILWAFLWGHYAYAPYYWYPDLLGWFYRLMEHPGYVYGFSFLSLMHLAALYGWVGAIRYRLEEVSASSQQGRSGGSQEMAGESGEEFSVVKQGEVSYLANMADKTPSPNEKPELLLALRREVVLPPEAEEEVVDLILLLRHYRAYAKHFGVKPPRGILLVGPPGTGKTSIARFIAKHSGLNFIAATPGELRSKWLGESAQKIRRLFQKARGLAPAVLFLDELDAVAPRRGGHNEVDHAVGQLLQELDGIMQLDEKAPVILIGASNHPEAIDPAVLSRIGTILTIPLPGPKERARILSLLLKEKAEGVDLEAVAEATTGFSGRDLQTVVARATKRAFTEGRTSLTTDDLLREVQIVGRGSKRFFSS